MEGEGEFPHEIGLFLGYPLCDVRGFIEDARGGVCLGCGYWKVYGEVEEREKLFKGTSAARGAYAKRWTAAPRSKRYSNSVDWRICAYCKAAARACRVQK